MARNADLLVGSCLSALQREQFYDHQADREVGVPSRASDFLNSLELAVPQCYDACPDISSKTTMNLEFKD